MEYFQGTITHGHGIRLLRLVRMAHLQTNRDTSINRDKNFEQPRGGGIQKGRTIPQARADTGPKLDPHITEASAP